MNKTGDFILNTWYVIAWSDEVTRKLLGRTVAGVPVVLYRRLDGTAAAIHGICPHRFAPLAMGNLIEDNVQCNYHGLEFDCSGKCVKNPQSGGQIVQALHIDSYPLQEKHSLLWVWLGDRDKAKEQDIPDFSHLTDPARRTVKGVSRVNGGHQLMVDNLMDLGHFNYLHGGLAKLDAGFENVVREVRQEGNTVFNNLLFPGCKPIGLFAPGLKDKDIIVDQFNDIRWDPVGLMRNQVGITPTGMGREHSVNQYGTHIVIPETADSCHYFFGNSRNFAQDDESVDGLFLQWQQRALNEEDKPMIEKIHALQPYLQSRGQKPVMLSSDGAAVRVQRIVESMLKAEQESRTAK
ncbi:MAG: aromatic ring-hydroxylating dioxygenase subunit alpha [Pseudomonadota bacterium]